MHIVSVHCTNTKQLQQLSKHNVKTKTINVYGKVVSTATVIRADDRQTIKIGQFSRRN